MKTRLAPTVLIASDHAGVAFKRALIRQLAHVKFEDLGPKSLKSVDYPDYAGRLCQKLKLEQGQRGILICGTGIGMSIAANKMPGIRAALVHDPITAQLARNHNDAQVLCLGARLLAPEYAAQLVTIFLTTPASREGRHHNRVEKIARLEQNKR